MSDNNKENAQPQESMDKDDEKGAKGGNPIGLIVLAILVIAGGIWGFNFYQYSSRHAETDDAYVTGDLINVSPVVSGTLMHLNVEEGQVVKKGDIVARLDDSGPTAAYQQALASWKAAESQVPQAQTNLTYTAGSIDQQIKEAEAALAAQNSKLDQENRKTQMTSLTVKSQLAQAYAQEKVAKSQVLSAKSQLASAKVAVRTAQAGADAVKQSVVAAQANATKAHQDLTRYAALYGEHGSVGAITAQQYDAAVAANQAAAAQLAQAKEQEKQAEESVNQAKAQVLTAQAAVETAESQAQAAFSAVEVAKAGLMQVPVQQSSALSSQHTLSQNNAALDAARVGLEQVKLRQQQISTTVAQAIAAKQAAEQAKVLLDDTIIRAPSNGVVVKKGANVGDALSPGQTIFTMTRDNHVWVNANYKETQLENIRPGESVDVKVDAYPGLVYHGKVQSIIEASGNATALLPADNATGNFTKVVQRIPVRIELIAEQPGNSNHYATQEEINRLRQGMSVIASVETKK
jgi:membrane fusion protein (multidrug efflux system)